MSAHLVWLFLAGGLLVSEMLTGTFYLLMLGIGALAGALCAWLGTGLTVQILVASLLGLAACFVVWQARSRQAADALVSGATEDPLAGLDIGQTVNVGRWHADGTCTVRYRGADWVASHAPDNPATHTAGLHRIVALDGSRLLITKV
jgi:membrane protein implicated in regulation of membrane protease activity